jgi:hypothetical protein
VPPDESVVGKLMHIVRDRPIDRSFISQERLDVRSRARTSAFPWRGQFTPGLVDALLDGYGSAGSLLLDPFVGSGTTLLEGVRRGLHTIGAEINPAAVELARVVELAGLPGEAREAVLRRLTRVLQPCLEDGLGGLFALGDRPERSDLVGAVALLCEAEADPHLRNLLAVTLMLGMGDGHDVDASRLGLALGQVRRIVRSLPDKNVSCSVLAADSRTLPLDDSRADLAVTSPPYINVFNYHQNYRPAIEALGWNALSAARTEIGSNRKHRGNRFLTVIQYAIDMGLTLGELHRVIRSDGRLVLVIGRESRVRGVAFPNGEILAALAEAIGGFEFERWQERSFTSRFGQVIFEEILTFSVSKPAAPVARCDLVETGRAVGCAGLNEALSQADEHVRPDIEAAVDQAPQIRPSSPLRLERAGGATVGGPSGLG